MNEFQDVISDEELVAKIRSNISDEQFFTITGKDIAGKSTQEIISVLKELFNPEKQEVSATGEQKFFRNLEKVVTQLIKTMKKNNFNLLSEKNSHFKKSLGDLFELDSTLCKKYEIMLDDILRKQIIKRMEKKLESDSCLSKEASDLIKARIFLLKNYNRAKMPNGLEASKFIPISRPTKTKDLFDKLRKEYPMD